MINLKNKYRGLLLIVIFVGILCISLNVYADNVSCYGVFNEQFLRALRDYIYNPIKWLTPVLLLVLTSVDFAKVVFAGKKEDMDKAKNNFLKRSIAAIIIFFAPDIIIFIVSFVTNQPISACISALK